MAFELEIQCFLENQYVIVTLALLVSIPLPAFPLGLAVLSVLTCIVYTQMPVLSLNTLLLISCPFILSSTSFLYLVIEFLRSTVIVKSLHF